MHVTVNRTLKALAPKTRCLSATTMSSSAPTPSAAGAAPPPPQSIAKRKYEEMLATMAVDLAAPTTAGRKQTKRSPM